MHLPVSKVLFSLVAHDSTGRIARNDIGMEDYWKLQLRSSFHLLSDLLIGMEHGAAWLRMIQKLPIADHDDS